jgi:hypothetical protein
LKKGEKWNMWGYFISGSLLAFIPVSVWIVFLYNQAGYDAVYTVVWTNNFGRFTGSHPEHVEPFYYYIKKFFVQLAPWTFLLPLAFVYNFLQMKKNKSQISLYFLCSAVIPYILLSISAGKRQVYLLPLYAFQAVLIGNMLGALPQYIAESQYKDKLLAVLKTLAYLLTFLFAVTAIVSIIFGFLHGIRFWLLIPIILFLAAVLTLGLDLKGYRIHALALMLISLAFLFASIDCIFIATAKKKYSYSKLFDYIKSLENNNKITIHLLNAHEKMRGAVVYYLAHTVNEINDKELQKINQHKSKNHIFIFDTGKYKKLPEKFKNMHVVNAFKIGRRYTLILEKTN